MSLRLYDYECRHCGKIKEILTDSDETDIIPCLCGGNAHRIISAPGVHLGNQDAKWIRESAAALIDREVALKSKDPLERKLATNPDRASVKAYMKQKGLRYYENEKGAPPVYKKPPEIDTRSIGEAVYKKFRKEHRRIEVR